MRWLAGSLVLATLMWMSLALDSAPARSSSPVVERSASRARRHAVDDEDDPRGEAVAGDLSSATLDLQKRPWGRNNVAVWGKRSADSDYLGGGEADKRRWGQKNMALWGKRFYDADVDDAGRWDEHLPTKRRWGQKHVAIWGKRSVGDMLKLDADQLEAQKRKWGQKNMALWG